MKAGVRFGGTAVIIIKATGHCKPTPIPIRQDYKEPALRKLDIPTAEHDAVLEAERLSEEVREENSRFSIECAATLLAPKRWLLDTGAPHDLTSINSVGKRIIARRKKANVNYSLTGVGGVTPINWVAPIGITAGSCTEKIEPFLLEIGRAHV